MRAGETALMVGDGQNEITVRGPCAGDSDQPPRWTRRWRGKISRKPAGTPFFVRDFQADIAEGYTLPAAALNALRRQALDELLEIRGYVLPHAQQPYEPAEPVRYRAAREQPALWSRFYEAAQITEPDAFERIILPIDQIDEHLIARFGEKLTAELPTLLFPEDESALGAHLAALQTAGLGSVVGEQHIRSHTRQTARARSARRDLRSTS